jgi:hypothetical protein
MSDYLQNLVERSIAPTPAVRPQIPSLFEPRSAKSTGHGPDGTDLPADSPDHATQRRATEQVQPTMNRLPKSDPETALEFPIQPVVQLPRVRDFRATPPENPETIPPLNPRQPVARNDAMERSPLAIESRPSPAQLRDAPPIDRAQSSMKDTEGDSSLSAEIRPRSVPEAKTVRRDSMQSDFSHPRKENGSGSARANPAPSNTIQVTIGRVEVRATSAPAASPRAGTKKGPAMSLENYLHRRAKGGRDE